jgi:membrane protein YqaA with SNARE-associated domain
VYRVLSWIQGVLIPQLGPLGLVAVAFLDSSFLSLPEINDILVVSAALANPATAWLPITLTTLGSVAGCSVLWFLGRRGGEALLERRFGRERTARTREAYRRWGILALAVPAIFPPPVPFKIFVLASGVFGFPFGRFVVTLLLARGARYWFWGGMGMIFGAEALAILHAVDGWTARRLPLLLAVAATVVLVVLVVVRHRTRAGAGVGGAS